MYSFNLNLISDSNWISRRESERVLCAIA